MSLGIRLIKVRKDHICGFCGGPIYKGSLCNYEKGREPVFSEHYDTQIGIKYWDVYLCEACNCDLVREV